MPKSGSSDIDESQNDEFQLFLFRKCRFDHIIHVGRNDPAS